VTTTIEESPGDLRERLEHEADAARERLMFRLDRLTERRDRVGRWLNALTTEAQRHRGALIGVGAAGLGVLGLLMLRRRARLRREQQREVLIRLAQRALPVVLGRLSQRH
jgi:hypothetical protein